MSQVKSRQRVTDHGEVFTSEREVTAMLDLVKQETERIDSRFLEPACGTGNFLTEILRRKLNIVAERYGKNQLEYERYSILALSSIYGIDVLKDNVIECRERLLKQAIEAYDVLFFLNIKKEYEETAQFLCSKNIILGDALTLMDLNGKNPIVFSEWSAVNGSIIKRRDYTMVNLLQSQPMDEPNLFSDLGDQAFIPTPVAEYPLTHFLKLAEYA
ncbi:SAM-dependent DNA methyltransferase [Pricia sp.]|uniref:SAM-dependent DNA methyltransferase n=1 Tax=Pricia sp. TaxID=2268138 RepID=UPI0035931F6A